MSSGRVEGSPIFGEQATFLCSGGSFGFSENAGIEPAARFSALNGDANGEADFGSLLSSSSGFTAMDDATIQFIGFGLESTLLDPNFIEDGVSFSVYELSGRLADNSSIDGGAVYIQNASSAGFELIEAPEPSAAALFMLSTAALAGSRRPRTRSRGALVK